MLEIEFQRGGKRVPANPGPGASIWGVFLLELFASADRTWASPSPIESLALHESNLIRFPCYLREAFESRALASTSSVPEFPTKSLPIITGFDELIGARLWLCSANAAFRAAAKA